MILEARPMASRGARRALPGHATSVDNIARVGDSFLSSDVVTFMSSKSESKTQVAAARVPEQVQRLSLFGPPLVLEGEDAAAYDEVFGRI
jgi:hypothetical protein